MAFTEKDRHDFFEEAAQMYTQKGVSTFMEMLPPAGWADVATKRDLDHLRDATRADLEFLRLELKTDIESVRQELKSDMESLRLELKADMESLRADFERTLRHQLVTIVSANVALVGLATALNQLLA